MKRFFGAAAVAAAAAAMMLSGCSDFSFNPVGTWKFEADIVYANNQELEHSTSKDMPFETLYVFGKCGTGHILVDGDILRNYTYEYDDNTVLLHVADSKDSSVIYDLTFHLSEDGKSLVRKEDSAYVDDDGEVIPCREEFVFVKQ